MEIQRKRHALADVRSVVERLAGNSSQQVEWVSRQRLSPTGFSRSSLAVVRNALEHLDSEFSPMLVLRIEALADQLHSMLDQPTAMLESADGMLQHSSWTVARHLAEAALRESGWPSL